MSAPRRGKRRKGPGFKGLNAKGWSRRLFLKRGGHSLAALSLVPLLPGCDASSGGGQPVEEGPVFRHGVASGDPLSDRVILWTRVTTSGSDAVDVSVTVATDPAMTQGILQMDARATPQRDFTVKIDMTGLAPATTYYYQFSARDQKSPPWAGHAPCRKARWTVCASWSWLVPATRTDSSTPMRVWRSVSIWTW